MLFYFQQQGQTQEAMETYANMINKKSGDPSSFAVATTNLISLKGTKDVADGLRKLDRLVEKSATSSQLQLIETLEFKLSPRQKEALYSARVLLLLHANKIDQVRLAYLIYLPFAYFCIKSNVCFDLLFIWHHSAAELLFAVLATYLYHLLVSLC